MGALTENPPHTHLTTSSPIIGITERRFVITATAQYDICPHGRTYPRKEIAINKIIILTPLIQTFLWALLR